MLLILRPSRIELRFGRRRWDQDLVEFDNLLLDVRLRDIHVDHRRLDVLVPHRLLNGERVVARHGHLRYEWMAVNRQLRTSCYIPGFAIAVILPL